MIYLASASPRRHELLLQIGVAHQVLHVPPPPGADEPILVGEAPATYVRRTAHDKALRALDWIRTQSLPLRPVLTADTCVILDHAILGKPSDLDDAKKMLKHLSGGLHEVHTAVVVAHRNQIHEDISITQVRFKPLSDAEIQTYCDTGEPLGKAGGYGIQGAAAVFIEHISGSYSGVMGLPVFETHRLLSAAS